MTLDRATDLLHRIAGPNASFRPGQWEAIEALVVDRSRALVVQRTGWGKSAVYLIATRLLRDEGRGPTLIVSPLLALMRNQIEMADRAGVAAETINSNNREDWEEIEARVAAGDVDLLLVSPERLANPGFVADVLPSITRDMGLLVVDEVHCISDWGHDFRPDYRRLSTIVKALPPGVPVLGTTATANNRVVEDVTAQLGDDLRVIRGTLERESLGLQVIELPNRADRLAWLAANVPDLPGAGIIYTLTIKDAERTGQWLKEHGLDVAVYTGSSDADDRLEIEEALSAGRLKAVVATSALGMGYDNPYIEFVIHYQAPGSAIAYYQQVGRAGRAVDNAVGVMLTGVEDSDIVDYFIRTAFPKEVDVNTALRALVEPMTARELEREVNIPRGRLTSMLKILEVEGAIYREGRTWQRSARPWTYPTERIVQITEQRRAEQAAMREYATTTQCLMQYLRSQLDDDLAEPCGRCANCLRRPVVSPAIDDALRSEAIKYLNRSSVPIPPRRQAVAGLDIPIKDHRLEDGRALSVFGDPGWAERVKRGKYDTGAFGDELVVATVRMIEEWMPEPKPAWLTAVPSTTRPDLVPDFAMRLADALGLEYVDSVRKARNNRPQKEMQNGYQQARNVIGAFEVTESRPGPVFLVDDMVDSRWTLTAVGVELLIHGSGPVYPVALVDTSRSGT